LFFISVLLFFFVGYLFAVISAFGCPPPPPSQSFHQAKALPEVRHMEQLFAMGRPSAPELLKVQHTGKGCASVLHRLASFCLLVFSCD